MFNRCDVSGIDVLLIVIVIILFVYYHGTKTFNHFEKLGIKCIKPVPYFGNTVQSTLSFRNLLLCHKEVYDKSKGERFIGFFRNRTPFLMIRDHQLIQSVLVKDFSHFYDRANNIDKSVEPLRAFNLVNLKGKSWKSLRQKLMTAFSSGKLKMMIPQFNKCSIELLEYLRNVTANREPINIDEAMMKYSTDVIGTCGFGLEFNSLRDPNSLFRRIGRDMLKLTFGQKISILVDAIDEKLPALLNITMFGNQYSSFFINFVKNTMKYREENNIKRTDFFQLLINLAKQESQGRVKQNNENNKNIENFDKLSCDSAEMKSDDQISLNDTVLAANVFVFFIAGFETSAGTLRNCLFELSLTHNLSIQRRLRKEILDSIIKHNDELTDDALKDLKYMDCVISETLRKYPVAGTLFRLCTKPYNIPGTSIVLQKGEKILISVHSLHHDPEYYPEPDLFDPERFNDDNKKKRPNFTYLPFGDGPRVCIGTRFALIGIKCALIRILSRYEIRLNSKTKLPLTWNSHKVLLAPNHPVFLDFKRIK